MARPKGRLLRLKLADIDRSLLPPDAGSIGSSTFQDAVSQLLRQTTPPPRRPDRVPGPHTGRGGW